MTSSVVAYLQETLAHRLHLESVPLKKTENSDRVVEIRT